MKLEDFLVFKLVYERLAQEVEGWDSLTEEERHQLVEAELVGG